MMKLNQKILKNTQLRLQIIIFNSLKNKVSTKNIFFYTNNNNNNKKNTHIPNSVANLSRNNTY